MKKIICLLILFLTGTLGFAQIQKPVAWEIAVKNKSELVFTAVIEKGWHVYDLEEIFGGPNPTTFTFERADGARLIGQAKSPSPRASSYEKLFGMDTKYFENIAEFIQKFEITGAQQFNISGYIEFSACTEKRCVNLTEEFSFAKEDLLGGAVRQLAAGQAGGPAGAENELWRPVINELNSFAPQGHINLSWLGIFLLCFAGGLVALLTPCVWPVIPLTVSFFLKRSPKNAVRDAVFYGLSILIIYVTLGLCITLIFGASALNDLATNAIANVIFFALLFVFGLSFLGLFEITLPASWANKINEKAQNSAGMFGMFFMAFTLALVSFSCTGPIIGTLLVKAATMGSIAAPAVGMFGFGLALAIPFAFCAAFPALLTKMPKSGGWMNTVKVTLGYLELALALKFLSVADQAYHWNLLSRELFLVLWIIIFAALGFYLLGIFRRITVRGAALAVIPLAFAAYMIPGLRGTPLTNISAFLPPLNIQIAAAVFNDYDEGMAFARHHNKPVLIDFTGYGCVNCRKMEAAVLSDPRVRNIIDNHFVFISLYVDDRTKLSEPVEVTENGKKIKLRTIGDKWSYLQRHKFGANAQPFYVLLNNAGYPLAAWYAFDEDVNNFINWLKKEINN